MPSAEWKDFAKPDEVRTFPHGRLELLHIGGGTGRASDVPAGLALVERPQGHREDEVLRGAALPVPRVPDGWD